MSDDIRTHSGSKYLRVLQPASEDGRFDVYSILVGYEVRCPAIAHAIKKLLCAGLRDKGDQSQDLKEARDAISRAIQLAIVNKPAAAKTDEPLPWYSTGQWEAVPALADGPAGHLIGYRVRWSTPDKDGKYLWVGHYMADEAGKDPTIGWCESAANSDAKRKNNDGLRPEETSYFKRLAGDK